MESGIHLTGSTQSAVFMLVKTLMSTARSSMRSRRGGTQISGRSAASQGRLERHGDVELHSGVDGMWVGWQQRAR